MTSGRPLIAVAWAINHVVFSVDALRNGMVPGISTNGSNLVVQNITLNDVRNNTEFQCMAFQGEIAIQSDPTILYVAGECTTISLFHCIYNYQNTNCIHISDVRYG